MAATYLAIRPVRQCRWIAPRQSWNGGRYEKHLRPKGDHRSVLNAGFHCRDEISRTPEHKTGPIEPALLDRRSRPEIGTRVRPPTLMPGRRGRRAAARDADRAG